jgi:D-alanine-D-alanine ligase
MRVCVLTDEEFEKFNPHDFLKKFEWQAVTLKRPVLQQLRAIAEQNHFDVYFNLCDASVEEDLPGLDVVQALEELNLAFTGASSNCYDPSRAEMQAAAESVGVGFARGFDLQPGADLERITKDLRYPLMVKHPRSFGSLGITRDSRVETPDQLRPQFQLMADEYGHARVEEFIVGPEFNVFVVDNPDDLGDPFVYPPTQLIFPEGEEFWHTAIKWDYSIPFDFRQVTEPDLRSRLQADARKLYLALGLTGYGRCDVRMNNNGELFILEINPNAGLLYMPEEYGPADYMILYDADGYDGFFDRIFRSAFARQQLRVAQSAA